MDNEKLKKEVSRLFSPPPWEHDPVHDLGYKYICQRCDITKSQHEYNWFRETECTVPPRIRLTDLGRALECYRNTCADVPNKTMDGYVKDMMHKNWRMKDFYADGQVILNLHWILLKATAEQIWEICVLAKESEK